MGATALAVRRYGIGLVGHRTDCYAPAYAHSKPYSHPAAHDPLANAIRDQPVPIPRNDRAQPVADDITDGNPGVRDTVGDVGPAVALAPGGRS